MKKAVVTVAAGHRLAGAFALLQSAKQCYPEYDAIVFQLDGDTSYEKDGCRVIPASSFFVEEEFLARAFAYSERDFEQVVTVKALRKLAREYGQLMLCSWASRFQAPIEGLAIDEDSITFCVDSREATTQAYNAGFLLGEHAYFYSPVWQLVVGERVHEFLRFCDEKMEYLHAIGITGIKPLGLKEYPIYKHGVFYSTWYNYAAALGCRAEFVRLPNLSLKSGAASDGLPLLNLYHLIWHAEKIGVNSPDFEQIFLTYYPSHGLALYREYVQQNPITAGYRFDFFEDGTPIVEALRMYYSFNYRLRENAGTNPFAMPMLFFEQNAIAGDNSLMLYSAPMDALWHMREDVGRVFPKPLEENRLAYLHWFLENGCKEAGYPSQYAAPAVASLQAYQARMALAANQRSIARKITDKAKRLLGRPSDIVAVHDAPPGMEPGVNLCGYIRGDFGVGEACRILAASLDAAGIPFTIIDFMPAVDYTHTYTNHSWDAKITNEFRYNTNILLTNAPGTRFFIDSVAPAALEGRYNIGYWYWELPEFPESWKPYLEPLDELWTSSEFTADSFRTATDKPVSVVPCCVEIGHIAPITRTDFGLGDDTFVFLMMYDAQSFNERKNPQGVLEAFLAKFEGNADVQLAIKVSAPEDWDYNDEFMRKAAAHQNVVLLKGTYPREKVNALLQCCDAFVSLHRSEGFGLGPAEAMYLCKPAILTNWSGNTQYMTPENCCPVDYEIVEITESFGEYRCGRHWAQPDTLQAAEYMYRLVTDRDYYTSVAKAGQKTIREQYNAAAVGRYAYDRLHELGRL